MIFLQNKNIWDYAYNPDYFIVITTNQEIKSNGRAVMGAGLAKQARDKYKDLDKYYANLLRDMTDLDGNPTEGFAMIEGYGDIGDSGYRTNFCMFPTKTTWKKNSDLSLITRNLMRMKEYPDKFVIPKLGCSNGKLDWTLVKSIIINILGSDENSDRFIILE